jgi:hypothetical protein
MKYILNFRDSKNAGAVNSGVFETGNGLGTEDDINFEEELIFLVHGFNINEDTGKRSLDDMINSLSISGKKVGFVSILWPGDHWAKPVNYIFENRDADDTALNLSRKIAEILKKDIEISFIAHSLGSRVVMQTIKYLEARDIFIKKIFLLAAAIDDFSLSAIKFYNSAAKQAEKVHVVWSRKDKVLRWAYPAADFLQSFLFMDDDIGLALGSRGPKARKRKRENIPKNVTTYKCSNKHSEYLPKVNVNPKQVQISNYINEHFI